MEVGTHGGRVGVSEQQHRIGLGPGTYTDHFDVSGRIPERIYESRIGSYLGPRTCVYSSVLGRLYYWNSAGLSIGDCVQQVLRGMGLRRRAQAIKMDQHGFFQIANRIELDAREFKAVHLALKLLGAAVRVDHAAVIRAGESA